VSAPVTIRGNLTADPKLRYSNAGKGIANFTVVTNRRTKNKQSGEWEDTGTTFWECVAFDSDYFKLAENICESCEKGMAVVVQGDVEASNWEDKNGGKRTSFKVMVNDCGPSLRNAQAKVTRAGGGAREYEEPPF